MPPSSSRATRRSPCQAFGSVNNEGGDGVTKKRALAFAGLLLLVACAGSALALASTGHKSKRTFVHNATLARRYGVLRRASTSVTQLPDDVASSAQLIAPGLKAADGRLAGDGSDGWSVWAAPTS